MTFALWSQKSIIFCCIEPKGGPPSSKCLLPYSTGRPFECSGSSIVFFMVLAMHCFYFSFSLCWDLKWNEESRMTGQQTCPLTIHFNMWTVSSDVSILRDTVQICERILSPSMVFAHRCSMLSEKRERERERERGRERMLTLLPRDILVSNSFFLFLLKMP